MDPWKRYRLLACIAVILAILAAGVWARIAGDWRSDLARGPWYECRTLSLIDVDNSGRFYVRANPFVVLETYYSRSVSDLFD